jgi:hypothetical protein
MIPAACWRRRRPPGGGRSPRRWVQSVVAQRRADRGRRNPNIKTQQFALDPLMAPRHRHHAWWVMQAWVPARWTMGLLPAAPLRRRVSVGCPRRPSRLGWDRGHHKTARLLVFGRRGCSWRRSIVDWWPPYVGQTAMRRGALGAGPRLLELDSECLVDVGVDVLHRMRPFGVEPADPRLLDGGCWLFG